MQKRYTYILEQWQDSWVRQLQNMCINGYHAFSKWQHGATVLLAYVAFAINTFLDSHSGIVSLRHISCYFDMPGNTILARTHPHSLLLQSIHQKLLYRLWLLHCAGNAQSVVSLMLTINHSIIHSNAATQYWGFRVCLL